jgi:small subunit ribosomal protein S21e
LITTKDHASVQINIGKVDANGVYIPGQYETVAFCGEFRREGRADAELNRIGTKSGILKHVV